MSYKNIFRFILIAAILTAFFASPLTVTAGSEVYTEGFLEYYIVDDAVEICGYFGTGGEVVVPSSIAGYPVSKILRGSFTDSRITVLYLPDTIMEIEEGAIVQGIDVVFDYHLDSNGDNTPTSDSVGQDGEPFYDLPVQDGTTADNSNDNADTENASLNTDNHVDGSETDLDDPYAGGESSEAVQNGRKALNVIIITVLITATAVTALIVLRQGKKRHNSKKEDLKK